MEYVIRTMNDLNYLAGHPELAPPSITIGNSGLRLLSVHTRATILHIDLRKLQVNAPMFGGVELFQEIIGHSTLENVILQYKPEVFSLHRLIFKSAISGSLSTLFLNNIRLRRREVLLFNKALCSNKRLNDLGIKNVTFLYYSDPYFQDSKELPNSDRQFTY